MTDGLRKGELCSAPEGGKAEGTSGRIPRKEAQMKEFQQEALDEKIARQEWGRNRLTKAWSRKRQMAMASSAYDASIMTETIAGSTSLLG